MPYTISSTLDINAQVDVGNLQFITNTISSTNTNGDILLSPNGTGTVRTDNLQLDGNTMSSTDTDGNLLLENVDCLFCEASRYPPSFHHKKLMFQYSQPMISFGKHFNNTVLSQIKRGTCNTS